MIKLFFEEGGAVASMTDKRRNGDIEVRCGASIIMLFLYSKAERGQLLDPTQDYMRPPLCSIANFVIMK
jgi:hypothetical protein